MQPPLSLILALEISSWSQKTKYACGPDIYASKAHIHIKINIWKTAHRQNRLRTYTPIYLTLINSIWLTNFWNILAFPSLSPSAPPSLSCTQEEEEEEAPLTKNKEEKFPSRRKGWARIYLDTGQQLNTISNFLRVTQAHFSKQAISLAWILPGVHSQKNISLPHPSNTIRKQ